MEVACKSRKKIVAILTHDQAKHTHIPTVEYQAVIVEDDWNPIQAAYERRNRREDP